ncbi:MAG: hypothetical protein QOF33_667 [Thermomicrobiales bacterium]|nr:hypothetical protein [Thermomicrobiales bacterium]
MPLLCTGLTAGASIAVEASPTIGLEPVMNSAEGIDAIELLLRRFSVGHAFDRDETMARSLPAHPERLILRALNASIPSQRSAVPVQVHNRLYPSESVTERSDSVLPIVSRYVPVEPGTYFVFGTKERSSSAPKSPLLPRPGRSPAFAASLSTPEPRSPESSANERAQLDPGVAEHGNDAWGTGLIPAESVHSEQECLELADALGLGVVTLVATATQSSP